MYPDSFTPSPRVTLVPEDERKCGGSRLAQPPRARRFVRRLAQAAVIALCAIPPAAHALADDEARRAILELRQQVRQLADQQTQSVQTRIQLADQIELLRSEIASLRGQIEQLDWQLRQPARGNPAQASAPRIDPIEQASFDAAMAQFRANLYADAATGFANFLTAHPTSTLTSQARFYHGSSLYATRQFKQAADALQALVQVNPQDARAADALLIVAASYIELNAMQEAQTTLQSIVTNYPQSQAAQTATQRLELLR